MSLAYAGSGDKKFRGDHVAIFWGRIIPQEDDAVLTAMGVKGMFRPGARLSDIAEFLRKECGSARL